MVVNYIQILYLCILKQQLSYCKTKLLRCELHSNLVSLHSETTVINLFRHQESCELHSNLVSLHSETTMCCIFVMSKELWITFKSCIFAFWNNNGKDWIPNLPVVNYIQILYLCILKQLREKKGLMYHSCELHSNLVSLHSETTNWKRFRVLRLLWITFKSCIFAFWNNVTPVSGWLSPVVNYIQILYLCILKQLRKFINLIVGRCELHSNLVSLHSETTDDPKFSLRRWLWITFKSCIFAFWNNLAFFSVSLRVVVNYIQILYLCILKQRVNSGTYLRSSCELHSNLVSLHSETTLQKNQIFHQLLWITFKSCIFAFWNNASCQSVHVEPVVNYIQILYLCILKQLAIEILCNWIVVNYIQILYLCILKQPWRYHIKSNSSCELHSNLVSLHSETTVKSTTMSAARCELHSNLVSLHSETTQNKVTEADTGCELHSNLVSLHSETTL